MKHSADKCNVIKCFRADKCAVSNIHAVHAIIFGSGLGRHHFSEKKNAALSHSPHRQDHADIGLLHPQPRWNAAVTAKDNGVGALALTNCAAAAVEDAFRDIVSEAVAEETSCSFVTESRSRASSTATTDEDSEESEDEDSEEELTNEAKRTQRRIDEYNQRQR